MTELLALLITYAVVVLAIVLPIALIAWIIAKIFHFR